MSNTKIMVFKNEHTHLIINSLDKMYPVFYNNDDHDAEWLKRNCINARLYYIYGGVIYDYTLKDIFEQFYMPHFVVVLNDCGSDVIDDYGWLCILQMFNLEIMKTANFDVECVRHAEGLLQRVDILKSEQSYSGEVLAFEPTRVDPEYSFDTIVENGVAFYMVTRSNDPLPFVVVLDKFDGDHTRFFTHIYSSKNWDSNRLECRFDFNFLCHVWKQLKMPGVFSIDIVNDYIKKCYPSEGVCLAEPIVYRTFMKNVVESYKSKKRGNCAPDFIVKKLNKI